MSPIAEADILKGEVTQLEAIIADLASKFNQLERQSVEDLPNA